MSAIVDFTVAVLDCAQCTRPFMASLVRATLHGDRVSCPHCDAQYDTDPDVAAGGGDLAHGPRRARSARARRAEALRLFGSLRRKLQ